jgi:hypothetical protein
VELWNALPRDERDQPLAISREDRESEVEVLVLMSGILYTVKGPRDTRPWGGTPGGEWTSTCSVTSELITPDWTTSLTINTSCRQTVRMTVGVWEFERERGETTVRVRRPSRPDGV